ncbi:U32 family peptidase [Pseudoalteromonas lipolytica]|uniref:Ubiquinone biosynthesis protein UbiV n=1 Tax=Pseudoalteromonas lipolytica TaxID=570156 RepID=A0AAD0S1C8_9GAMM|nr:MULTISPECIES: U32 family peptidase [Pseudoalteromonas]AXV66303.1 U32 family peptidase [Pseudoalteromonas donghaensis]QPL42435.1 U32 family peptidase [Pseudoalteromonas sp. A41-2]
MTQLKVAVGPMLFLWQKELLEQFYERVAQSTADIVYLGETVCGKRRLSRLNDYLEWAKMLEQAGKEVVLSSLALLESGAQLQELKRVCRQSAYLIEANDLAAVQQLHSLGLPFVIGPAINVYNGYTLAKFAQMGAVRWVMPVELSRDWLVALKHEYAGLTDLPMQFEVFSYGLLPLAYSARCFTARHYDLAKDQCELTCQKHPSGLMTHSQDGKKVFTLNGIQTMSGQVYNLCEDRHALNSSADIARLSMHDMDDLQWIESFALGTDSKRPDEHINGFWHHIAGMHCQS